ncbi:hypothetical protein HOD96_02605 [Candidatus Falkowbacteria bacterium]|jgi:hypothetical protein|nr:hypothetical protein [Candidatus Falkowbacteria bacterium]MBT4433213.1 hypothetical protein [Candidatus Falkowbacteria bacterium]
MSKKLTKKGILTTLEANAKKLAILLYDSNIPEDVKDSWIAMLPEMSLEQIDKLLEALEENFLDEQTKDINIIYLEEMNQMFDEFEKERKKVDNKFLRKVKNFKKKLKTYGK